MFESASKAVFLSYASQDAEAARSICESLRAGGMEVWFDADGGLEHGDEWDAKIRRQIKECVLFIPILSANTQARLEGYFRIEWELAAERAMGIAAGVPFILPIVIDGTREPDALVPDRFRKVQWTRIPGGNVSPEVQARIVKLWSHRTGVLAHEAARAGASTITPSFAPAETRPQSWKWPALAAAAVAVIATGVWLATRRAPAPAPAPAPSASIAPTKRKADPVAVATAVIAKPRGIAVLPFENLDTADQAFFSAGITEEVTQQLAKIRSLRVMSPKAAERFKGAAELPAMARELAVGAVLAGSVRRAGDVVRISVQLLAAPSGETLWAEQYDRPAKDIFAVQSDVAKNVVRALQTALSPQERARIERPPTTDVEAFALYLRAERAPPPERIDLLKRAVALDPKFALAYCALSWIYVRLAATTGRDDHNRALEAARMAVALDPQLAAAHYNLGNALASLGQIDAGRLAHLRAIELSPSFSPAFNDLSVLEANAGRMDQSFYWAKRSFPLAPNLAYTWYHVAGPLMMLDEAAGERWLRAGIARFPANDPTGVFRLHILLACLEFTRGQPAAAMERMRRLAAERPNNPEVRTVLTELAVYTGALDARERVDQAMTVGPGAKSGFMAYSPRALRAFLWIQAGEREQARPLIDAALAENRAAIAAGDRNYSIPHENAALHLMLGDRAAALESLEAAANSGFLDASLLKVNPLMAPLANEPRFRQVVDRIERNLREMRSRVDLSDLDALAAGGQR